MVNIPNHYNLFTPATIFLSLLVLFCSCGSPFSITVKKEIYKDTIDFNGYTVDKFHLAYATINLEKANEFATTDAQKQSLTGLKYIFQNKYDSAANTFIQTLQQPDSLDMYWKDFTISYYSEIDYNWIKLKELSDIRPDIKNHWFQFYIDKPKFKIDFVKDSVVIPLEFDGGIPQIVLAINGKKFVLIVDTGCDKTLFYQKIMKHLATTGCDTNGIKIGTIDGNTTGYNCFLPQLDLNDIKINNFPISTTNQDELKIKELLFITTFQCDGIIGWDLLHHFDFTIDYKNAQLILRKPVKRNTKNRNLFWYQKPIISLYTDSHHPMWAFFDTGSNITSFSADLICGVLKIDKSQLKKNSIKRHDINDWIKTYYYNLPNFNLLTISDNIISYINVSKARLEDFETYRSKNPLYVNGKLGSDWFKDKIVRVDMTNGIFEISE